MSRYTLLYVVTPSNIRIGRLLGVGRLSSMRYVEVYVVICCYTFKYSHRAVTRCRKAEFNEVCRGIRCYMLLHLQIFA
jgi:hypothetical protein